MTVVTSVPFLFRPYCELLAPFTSCSNGWLFYYTLGMMTAISFRNLLISALSLILLITLHEYTTFGIPGVEATFQWMMGSFVGLVISQKFLKRAPPFVEDGIFRNFTGFLEITFVLALAGVLFFAVDDTILENERPYGLAATFIMIACWLFAATFFLYCVLGVEKQPPDQQKNYWVQWLHLAMVVFLIMFFGFIPDISSYVKSAIATMIAVVVIVLIK
jgi:hypothetical protein